MTRSSFPTPADPDSDARALNADLRATFNARRGRLGLSQRAYAQRHGWSAARVSQLENEPVRARLGHVLEALRGTGYALSLVPVGHEFWDHIAADLPPSGQWSDTDAIIIPLRPRNSEPAGGSIDPWAG